MRGARPKDSQDDRNLSGGLGEVSESLRLTSPAYYLYTSRFRVWKSPPDRRAISRTQAVGFSRYRHVQCGQCKWICLSAFQPGDLRISDQRRKGEEWFSHAPRFGEMLPVTFSHPRPSPPARAGSPFQIRRYLSPHSHVHINLSHTSSLLPSISGKLQPSQSLATLLLLNPSPRKVHRCDFHSVKCTSGFAHLKASAPDNIPYPLKQYWQRQLVASFFRFLPVTLRLVLSTCSLDLITQRSPLDYSNHMENSLL